MENNSLNKANGEKVMSKEELSEYIISAYDSGETMVDIANDVGRSKIYISKIIHQVYDDEEIKVRQYNKLRGKN
ncbi:MAG: hypothetical protein J6P91_02700, partial [Methanobrevibacter sp.]|nr:hypothetical protein [Methanobrevibacter sp.]